MPSTTTTENHSITYPAEGVEGWYATWETLIQDITDNFDNIVNFRCAILKDTSGNELMAFTATGSAVNHLGLANAATGNAPVLETLGDDTNIDGIFQAKGTGSIISENLVVGQVTNLGVTYSSNIFSVSGAKAALSATNPGFLCLPSKTAGLSVTIKVVADQGFIDDTGSSEIINNLFGATTGVAWDYDCPFYIYAVLNDAESTVAFMCSRIPHRTTAPVTAEIGAPDDSVADEQYSFFSFDNIDETLYDGNPCICIGSFRMRMSASDDWTVQALNSNDGIGRFQEGLAFIMPQGQKGADSGAHTIANGGTSPVFQISKCRYQVTKDGFCRYGISLRNDGGTDGSGAVPALVCQPLGASVQGTDLVSGVSSDSGMLMITRAGGSLTSTLAMIGNGSSGGIGFAADGDAASTFVEWGDFTNGQRDIWGVLHYSIKSE